jgi:hypothetical protein
VMIRMPFWGGAGVKIKSSPVMVRARVYFESHILHKIVTKHKLEAGPEHAS